MAIDRAAARRTISPRQALGLHRDARHIQDRYLAYRRGGISHGEAQDLQRRVDRVRAALHRQSA